MLAETDRNREMCNQIMRRVFPNPTQTNDLLRPVGLLVSIKYSRTRLNGRQCCVLIDKIRPQKCLSRNYPLYSSTMFSPDESL